MDEAKLRDIPMFAKLSRKQRKLLALRADEVDVKPGGSSAGRAIAGTSST